MRTLPRLPSLLVKIAACLSVTSTLHAAADDPADWMQQHLDSLGDRPLKQLALPASHDAAMYLSTFPQSLAQTQLLNLHDQLAVGVRYFDLRPQSRDGKLFIHHGAIIGPPLSEVLGDVRRFIVEGHRELIILKFSHYDGIDRDSYQKLVEQIKENLGQWLYTSLPKAKRLAEITLHEYIRDTAAVLVVCDGSFPLDVHTDGIWVYRDWDSAHPEQGDLRVFDQYANTISFDAMKKDQLAKFNAYDGRCKSNPNVPCDLFLLSWTLTPPTNVLQFAKEPNAQLPEALANLKQPNPFGRIVNLLYIDAIDSPKITNAALSLNQPPTTQP